MQLSLRLNSYGNLTTIESIACYVWAIDGYPNDNFEHNLAVINNFILTGSRIAMKNEKRMLEKKAEKKAKKSFFVCCNYNETPRRYQNLIVNELVKKFRIDESTRLACTIHGSFGNDGSSLSEVTSVPDHMWLEFRGFIYDTSPGSALYRISIATPADYLSPYSYRDNPADRKFVGSAVATLSRSQLRIIQDNQWASENNFFRPERLLGIQEQEYFRKKIPVH